MELQEPCSPVRLESRLAWEKSKDCYCYLVKYLVFTVSTGGYGSQVACFYGWGAVGLGRDACRCGCVDGYLDTLVLCE